MFQCLKLHAIKPNRQALIRVTFPRKRQFSATTTTPSSSSDPEVGRLILVRHGQSHWNITDPSQNLTARFTGWADIGLTDHGRDQARATGRVLSSVNMNIDCVATSLLGRSQETMNLILHEMNLMESNMPSSDSSTSADSVMTRRKIPTSKIPVISSWRLNERHYGSLVGLSKESATTMYNEDDLREWRYDWNRRPPPMDELTRREWSRKPHCRMHTIIRDPAASRDVKILEKGYASWSEPNGVNSRPRMPESESLRDTCERVLPLWTQGLAPRLRRGESILLVAHANTIKAMLRTIDPNVVTKESFNCFNIPSAMPLVYCFRKSKAPYEPTIDPQQQFSIPGGLEMIPPPKQQHHVADKERDSFRYKLHGEWIESDEIEKRSFCTNLAEESLAYEIA